MLIRMELQCSNACPDYQRVDFTTDTLLGEPELEGIISIYFVQLISIVVMSGNSLIKIEVYR